MMYSIESIEATFERLSHHFTCEEVKIPAPDYTKGPNWTDELRIKNGFTQLEDGSWATIVNSKQLFDLAKKEVIWMYEQSKKTSQEVMALRKKNYELEYACRVAAKAVTKSQSIKEEIE